ncbi:MAG: helix-turn-helix transcriptional regulator [Octadecabacter sp.]
MVFKKQPNKQQQELADKHRLALTNLDNYSDFLNTWQSFVDDTPLDDLPDPSCFSDFEDYAAIAVQAFLASGPIAKTTDGGPPISHHDCAAVTSTATGLIRQTNLLAFNELGLTVGKTLSHAGVTFMGNGNIPNLFQNHKQGQPTAFQILQAELTQTNSFMSLAISQIPETETSEPLFLILFIAPPDSAVAAKLLGQRFDYTSAEVEIAKLFLDGLPLRDIATRRGRSYPTIRNQFQSVLDKSGCTAQTELFRLAFSVMRLVEQTKTDQVAPPAKFTRTMTVPRPKGRVVEVVLCGDENGRPLLSFPSLFGHGLTPDIAQDLHDRGVLLISILRPGFGITSFAAKSDDLFDCAAGDVRAILDLLEIDKCPCVARASAARPFYNAIARLPDRISHGVISNGMIPRNYITGKTVVSKWTSALMSASILSYPIAKLILGTGHTLLMRSNGGSFLQKMYQGSQVDHALFEDPNVVSSVKTGAKNATHQGLGAGIEEIVGAFQNWSDDLQDIASPITVYHGRFDPNVPITGVEDFVRDHAHQLSLVTEETGGGQLSYSHFANILDLCFPN